MVKISDCLVVNSPTLLIPASTLLDEWMSASTIPTVPCVGEGGTIMMQWRSVVITLAMAPWVES